MISSAQCAFSVFWRFEQCFAPLVSFRAPGSTPFAFPVSIRWRLSEDLRTVLCVVSVAGERGGGAPDLQAPLHPRRSACPLRWITWRLSQKSRIGFGGSCFWVERDCEMTVSAVVVPRRFCRVAAHVDLGSQLHRVWSCPRCLLLVRASCPSSLRLSALHAASVTGVCVRRRPSAIA